MKKILEHIGYLMLTVILTYLVSGIRFLNDTHRFVKEDLLVLRTQSQINLDKQIKYDFYNKGALKLDSINTLIEYRSNLKPLKAVITTNFGTTKGLKLSNNVDELLQSNFPNWLSGKDQFSIIFYYSPNSIISDDLKLKYIKNDSYTTISANQSENSYSMFDLAGKLKLQYWIILIETSIILLLLIYLIKFLTIRLCAWIKKYQEESFISNKQKFLK